MSNIFQNLEMEAFRKGITPRTKESMAWFRKRAENLSISSRRSLMRENPLEIKPKVAPGSMFLYFYDPKHKKTLPYYDKFPLIVMVDWAPGGFYGLNLHYLPPVLRAKFLDKLLETISNKKYDETTNFKLSWELLKSTSKMKYFEPCYKHYLNNHVRSHFSYVPPPEWEIATFLPVAQFEKESQAHVWRESRKMVK